MATTEQTWSKGQWRIADKMDECPALLLILDEDGNEIASVCSEHADRTLDFANARLMRAAPTMYHALRAIYGKLDPGELASPEEIDWACRVALDAMGKARGEQ